MTQQMEHMKPVDETLEKLVELLRTPEQREAAERHKEAIRKMVDSIPLRGGPDMAKLRALAEQRECTCGASKGMCPAHEAP